MNNIVWHNHSVTKEMHAELNAQRPCLLWFTGLSGSGKSTIANALELELHKLQQRTYLLDGDNVRHGLNKDLGFSDEDRVENIRRVGEVSRLFVDAGLIVLSAFISPFRSDRQIARDFFPEGEFIEVYVSTPLAVCEERDPKGLYQKAREGVIKQFTGIDSPYEEPEAAELVLDTSVLSVRDSVEHIISYLRSQGRIS
ncbi:adenylyl-sulfate kinase [Teredinibacter sp. KSP-S5-2]|uniref:adenylyl-sulfate kinase n=1 Tax=Teredinibacter sp. KSP-S5-2 TaxID=3034506 RepID=UPI002934F362|nr:adenylyl-sulfate kinase [Teredinibacter sp. KSP-S5-2]WNO07876.1 adenylyl-sulfate kinase [Teredinibacter sp. KSP-S5-2]